MKNRNNTRERARQVGWIVVAAFLLWGVCDCRGDAEKPKSFLDAQAILDAWQRNYTGIVSQKLRLSSRVVKGGDPCEIQYYCIERTDDGSRFHVWQTTSPLGFEEKERVVVTSFDGRVSKECLYSQRGPIGYITPGRIGTLAATDNPLAIILGTKRDDLDPGAADPHLLNAAAGEGLLELPGNVDDVRPFIAGSDCVVLPSFYREGTPRSLLEAAAMGKPLIAADSIGTREPVRDGENGFLCRPRDPADLAAKMLAMLELSKEARLKMGAASRRIAEERFDEQIVIGKYLQVIEHLAAQG